MIAIIRRVWLALFPPKVAWKPTGIRYTFTGHDQEKASAAVERAKTLTPHGTPLRLKDRPTKKPEALVEITSRRRA